MKYLKKVFIWVILISIILIIFVMRQDDVIMELYDEECHIKIDNKEITILNNREERLDTYILKEKIRGYSIGDIDGDRLDELILLTKGRMNRWGKEIVILKLGQKIEEIYREDFSKLKPWKVALGDIDGDGKSEVSIGVYKKTQFHDVMAKRPFIYSYEGHRLVPKWKGSRLSKPFTDYVFYDIDEDEMDEIISIEVLENKEKIVNTYKWEGFGFQGFLESKSFIDIRDLKVIDGCVYVQIKEKGDTYIGELKIKDNNLIIERVNIR